MGEEVLLERGALVDAAEAIELLHAARERRCERRLTQTVRCGIGVVERGREIVDLVLELGDLVALLGARREAQRAVPRPQRVVDRLVALLQERLLVRALGLPQLHLILGIGHLLPKPIHLDKVRRAPSVLPGTRAGEVIRVVGEDAAEQLLPHQLQHPLQAAGQRRDSLPRVADDCGAKGVGHAEVGGRRQSLPKPHLDEDGTRVEALLARVVALQPRREHRAHRRRLALRLRTHRHQHHRRLGGGRDAAAAATAAAAAAASSTTTSSVGGGGRAVGRRAAVRRGALDAAFVRKGSRRARGRQPRHGLRSDSPRRQRERLAIALDATRRSWPPKWLALRLRARGPLRRRTRAPAAATRARNSRRRGRLRRHQQPWRCCRLRLWPPAVDVFGPGKRWI